MHKTSSFITLCCLLLLPGLFTSCSKGFESINQSPDFVSAPNVDYLLTAAELYMLDNTYYTQGDYVAPIVGQVTQQKTCIQLNTPGDETGGLHFKWMYQNPLKNLADIISRCQGDTSKINYLCIARIMRVYCFQVLTDVYGDVPYFQANEGYTGQVLAPAFDAQQDIYTDMFKELQEATAAFDPSKSLPATSDIVYKGVIVQWKKFANSLMLRMGLRIMKADPANGTKWINQAVTGGLFIGNADNFVVNYLTNSGTGGTSNPTANGQPWIFINYPTKYRYTSAFVDSLKFHSDPRIPVYLMLPGNSTTYAFGDTTSAKQQGYPMFGSPVFTGTQTRDSFSVSNIQTFGRLSAPYIHLSYAQVLFQLAECTYRGIITGPTSAQTYYENGIRAAMSELSIYNTAYAIPSGKIDTYIQQNPYDPANALKMINTQYWIETNYNWYEAFANMRRSGYPDLYSQFTDGSVLARRLTYPPSENAANPHLQDAVKRQGPDVTSTRMWWDKQ